MLLACGLVLGSLAGSAVASWPGLPAVPAGAALPAATYQNPVAPFDAPDPDVIQAGGTYYAFSTGSTFGHIQEFQSTDLAHWTPLPLPGALTQEPAWVNPGLEWAPSVAQFGSTWVMYYATFDENLDASCIAEATASQPAGPYVDSLSAPIVCLSRATNAGLYVPGDIDPDVFIDGNGTPYLLWSEEPLGNLTVASLWSEPLAPDGQGFAFGSEPTELLSQGSWPFTIENPALVQTGGAYYLFFSAGNWGDSSYEVGHAVCAGPSGPCRVLSSSPILQSGGAVVGPGGQWPFQDPNGQWWMAYSGWTPGQVGYSAGGARSLRIDPLCFVNGGQGGPGDPVALGPTAAPESGSPTCPTLSAPTGYRLVASDGGLFAFGGAPFRGSTGGRRITSPVVAMADQPGSTGYWEVTAAGKVYAFGAPGFGDLAGDALSKPIVAMASTPDGQGYWLVASDGGVFAFGDATFFGSTGNLTLQRPVVGVAPTMDGGGYWLVASDGGTFSFGDAAFMGSMGGQVLNKPVVGMAATADGGGYWLVASDGGVFSFGDAFFRGSTGAMRLNKPIVAIEPEGDGGGYWMVASDGGVFAFGAAPFEGSTGNLKLNAPIVGMTST